MKKILFTYLVEQHLYGGEMNDDCARLNVSRVMSLLTNTIDTFRVTDSRTWVQF